jgi:hypothetical protein
VILFREKHPPVPFLKKKPKKWDHLKYIPIENAQKTNRSLHNSLGNTAFKMSFEFFRVFCPHWYF